MLVALCLMAQVTALGANDQLLQAVAASANILIAGAVLLIFRPTGILWRGALPALLLLALALLWAVLPDLLGRATGGVSGGAIRNTPDLLLTGITRFLGGTAMLLTGAMIGYHRGMARATVRWCILLGFVNLAIGFGLRQVDQAHIWGFDKSIHRARFSGTLVNANAAGTIFAMLLLLSIGQALDMVPQMMFRRSAKLRIHMALAIVCAIGFLSACLLTESRSASLLGIIGAALLVMTARAIRLPLGRTGRLAGIVFLSLSLLLLVMLVGMPTLVRLQAIDADSIDRLAIWTQYWMLAGEAPFFGYGLGSFSDMNMRYAGDAPVAIFLSYINAAHNQALQLILAGGWPFLLLQLGAVGMIIWTVMKGHRRIWHDPFTLSVLLALFVVAGASMVDIALTVPAILSLSACFLGLLWGRAIRRDAERGFYALPQQARAQIEIGGVGRGSFQQQPDVEPLRSLPG
jgi:O-antigen ligase